MNCEMHRLDEKSAKNIYKNHMKADFPPDELKPFALIKRLFKKGLYEFFELTVDDSPIGYAFCLVTEDKRFALLDYFAVYKELREKGLGSAAINEIKKHYGDELGINLVLESEDPEFSKNAKEIYIRERRVDFYRKNGMLDSGVFSKLAGVNYQVFMYPACDAEEAIDACYQTMLPKRIVEKKLMIFTKD